MAIATSPLHTPLRSLGLSHEAIRLIDACGIRTVEDFEDNVLLLFRCSRFKQELLTELIHVTTLFLASENIRERHAEKLRLLALRKPKRPYVLRYCLCMVRITRRRYRKLLN